MLTVAVYLLVGTSLAANDTAFLAADFTAPVDWRNIPAINPQMGVLRTIPQAKLMLAHADGSEIELLPGKAVQDFSVALDARSLLVTVVDKSRAETGMGIVVVDTNINRLDLVTRSLTPLTTGAGSKCQAVETRNGIAYLSNEDGWQGQKVWWPAYTIYRMDKDGKNKRRIWHVGFGGVFALFAAPNGRIYFASGEVLGFRGAFGSGQSWSIWSINEDGSDLQPEVTGGRDKGTFQDPTDWPCVTSSGHFLYAQYYDNRSMGYILCVPPTPASPFQPLKFGFPEAYNNPPIKFGWSTKGGFRETAQKGFQRTGLFNLIPDTSSADWEMFSQTTPSVLKYVGMVSHPYPIPGNGIYLTRVSGSDKAPDLGVYAVPDVSREVADIDDLAKVVDKPRRHEWFGKPVVRYGDTFGIDKPAASTCPKADDLPPGSPFAVIGTSDLSRGEWVRGGTSIGESVRFTRTPGDAEWLRVLGMNPNNMAGNAVVRNEVQGGFRAGTNNQGFHSQVNERIGYYEQLIPLKKYRKPDGSLHLGPNPPANSTPIMRADGTPDTSFRAYVPANQPITFQLLNPKKEAIVGSTAETWRQFTSREVRTNCQGCHDHHVPDAVQFSETLAASAEYPKFTLDKLKVVTREKDLPAAVPALVWKSLATPVWSFSSSATDWDEKLPVTEAERVKVRAWIDTGMLEGAGADKDAADPTLVVSGRHVGAFDPQSGLKSLVINNVNVTALIDPLTHIYTHPSDFPANSVFVATDWHGNTTREEWSAVGTIDPPPSPPPPATPPPTRTPRGVYLGIDGDHLGNSRSQTPDGKLDHHIRLEGLRHPVVFIEVKAGSGDTDWKWSDRAGEEANPKYAPGGWWWVKHEPRIPGSTTGVMDLWLSEPTPAKPHTDFRVYVFYSEDLNDRDAIVPGAPPPPGADESLRRQMADLQAQQTANAALIAQLQAEIARLRASIETVKQAARTAFGP